MMGFKVDKNKLATEMQEKKELYQALRERIVRCFENQPRSTPHIANSA